MIFWVAGLAFAGMGLAATVIAIVGYFFVGLPHGEENGEIPEACPPNW